LPLHRRPDRRDPLGEATEGATVAATMRPVPVDRCRDPWGIIVSSSELPSLGWGAHRWVTGGNSDSDGDSNGGGPGLPAGAVAVEGPPRLPPQPCRCAMRSKGVDEGRMDNDATVVPLVRQRRDGGGQRCGCCRGCRCHFRGDVSVGPVGNLPPPPRHHRRQLWTRCAKTT
jgi:hypothetical protein